jgi:tyrosine phenol-lyase
MNDMNPTGYSIETESVDSLSESTPIPFKGNIDIQKLTTAIDRVGAARIPYISVAATVNMAGGQPISI